MNVVKLLNNRQYGFINHRLPPKAPIVNNDIVPKSSFEAFNVSNFLKLGCTDLVDSPPIAISLRDDNLLVTNDNGDISLIRKQCFQEKLQFSAHSSAIFDVKWRPDYQHHCISGSGDRTVKLWDIEKTECLLDMNNAHLGSVKSISFYDNNVFASGARDGFIKVWDLRTTGAIKYGPEFQIQNGHNCQLPSSRSPRAKTVRSRRHFPIASANEPHNFFPSNVVTCVNFHPTNNNLLYSSGVADSGIKVWDIRRCRREFQYCSKATPVKNYSIKNCKSLSTTHGFSSFLFNNSKYGPVMYALSTDNNIYAFLNNSSDPVMIFTGCLTNHFTKFTSFGEDYLICGSKNGNVCIWDCNIKLPLIDTQENQISIQKQHPIYQIPFDDFFGQCIEMSLVCVDYPSKQIIFGCENQALFKCDFFKNKSTQESNIKLNCVPYTNSVPNTENKECKENVVNINLKRASSFNSLNIRMTTSLTKPLSSLTSWIQNSDNKRLRTCDTPDQCDANARTSKSTSFKNPKRSIKKRKSRRNLFDNNRKISEFFTM